MSKKKDLPTEEDCLARLLAAAKKNPNKIKVTRLRRAYEFGRKAHQGQFRASGEPYICHPTEAATMLAELGMDEDTLVAALLHDVPEDTMFTVEDVEKRFGKHVATLVSALTKLSKVYYRHSMDERQVRSLRKLFLETANDPRVVIIKLADRLHNLGTLRYLRPDKQQRIAKESLEIYAPLANLYGIYEFRRQIEDHCFEVLQPDEYKRIEAYVHEHEKERRKFIKKTCKLIEQTLERYEIKARTEGRPKHLYSIYKKTLERNKLLKDVYDYFAIRIITETKEDCYAALGVVHELFKPKPGRMKDYIALPKPNGYQSLHTTVIGPEGKLTEVQIRSEAMHREAEHGAASHMNYKGAQLLSASVDVLKKYKNPEKFMKGLQDEVLTGRIYVFSLHGDVINLPEGSTCLDYIYAAGLPVDREFQPRVNNQLYSLTGELQTGDRIEIYYTDKQLLGPERWWLDHVKTSKAKRAIQDYFAKKSYQERVRLGEQLLQQAMDHENQGFIYQIPRKRLRQATEHFQVKHFEQLLSELGEGRYTADRVYKALYPNISLSSWARFRRWIHELLERRGYGLKDSRYKIRVVIDSYDRKGLIKDLVKPFYDLKLPILKVMARGFDVQDGRYTDQVSRVTFDVLVDSHEQLIALFDRLERVQSVRRVYRAFRQRQVSFIILALLTTSFFVLHPIGLLHLQNSRLVERVFWFNFVIYVGLLAQLGLVFWLGSLIKQTFPYFGETRWFWPIGFGATLLTIVILLIDDYIFDLQLQLPVMFALAFFTFALLYRNYTQHRKRRRTHLQSLTSKAD